MRIVIQRVLNASVTVAGEQVAQFTLFADCRRGNRPSFTASAPPDEAKKLYQLYIEQLRSLGLTVKSGIFQADMQVQLVNDGPVTVIIDKDMVS